MVASNSGYSPCIDKDEMEDLSANEKKTLKGMLKAELEARR